MEQCFSPTIWAEDPLPEAVKDCTLCELNKQRTRIVWGEGNPKADIVVILDNPGSREDKDGNAIICGTRQTLQFAADSVGLNEKDLYITYILKCRPVRKYNKENARETCLGYLNQQLQISNFKIAFCLGDAAVKTFFSDPERDVKGTRGAWHYVRNIPTYVSYHPLAVRRRPNLYGIFVNDWEQVASKLR
ncbi:MAG TPA: uracil-DNA glycosylase [Clostridia bacterium]|nr:uracil-DNA glycosylase [Clostridia bacterium]